MADLSLEQGANIAASDVFQKRVAMAFYYVAREVITEAASVTGHQQRVEFARSIILQDYSQVQRYAALVVTDRSVVAAGSIIVNLGAIQVNKIDDTQIISAVRAMWNSLASVPNGSTPA